MPQSFTIDELDAAPTPRSFTIDELDLPPIPQQLPTTPPPPDTPEGRRLAALLASEEAPKRPLFARPGVLARSPASIPEAFQAVGGQLLHPIKSTEAAIEQFTGAPKFSGPYAPPVKHVSEILELGPKIPKIAPQKGTAAQVGAGVVNATSAFLDFFLTPAGATTLGIGSLPRAAQQIVLTEFAAGMAAQAPDQLREGVRLIQEGKTQEGVEHLTSGAGGALLSAKLASHIPERIAPQTAAAAKEPITPDETPTPPQQPGAAPVEAPVAPEPVAPARPTTEGTVREPVAPETVPTGQPARVAGVPDTTAKRARLKELREQIAPLAEKGGLTAAEAERFKALNAEANSIRFDLQKPLDISKIPPPAERQSTIPSEIVVTARNDLMRDKSVYTPIIEAAVGVSHDAYTPVDAVMAGQNPNVSATKLYDAFSATREQMRAHYGDTVKLFRATTQQREKPTQNWATTEEYAKQFGKNVISRDVPIDDVIAVNVGPTGNYHEVIVGKKPTPPIPEQPVKAAEATEESKTPPPDVEQLAMLAGSHIAGIPDPISLAFAVTFGTKTGRQAIGEAVRFYSEPLSERLATEGGSNSKGFSNMAREISQRSKELYGSLTSVLDPALEATGKMNRTTAWLNDIAPTKKRWGFRNAQTAVEGPIENVPAEHRGTVELVKAANLRIGQLAEPVVEGFKATGRYQRPPTDFLIDTIRAGQGQAFDIVKNALAAENKIHPEKVKKILRGIKEEMDAPGSEQTVHRIAQEFERHFRKFPTDIRITTPVGEVWMPILHAKPFEYLQNAATRTAQRVSFLERVPKGTLPELRKAVVSELKSPEAFDDLVRALHGLPVNQPLRFFAPGSLQSMIAQGANRVLTDVFGTLKLTASAVYNIPETVFGNTPAFFGWRNFARGALSLKDRWAKLEELGAINRAIYNFSFDPKAPVRSVLNDFRLGIRKATMQQFFNEMQEMLAASTAQVFAERASGKLLSPREQGLFTETAVAMGFTRPAARAMAEGRGSPEQYGRFTQRAAAFATGGNIQPAELSRFGGNRVLTSLFRFQSYPMMKLNAFRKAYTNFAEAVESKDPGRIKASSEQLAKFLFGTTAQGAATVFLAALLSGRGGGVEQTAQEAEDNPGKFIFDSLAGGMGGPVSAINYVVGTGKSRDLLDPSKINAGITFPGSIYLELKQLFNTEGPYAGMTMENAVQKYLQTRVPAGKMVRHAFEEAGLVSGAETARGNLYRLHQDWLRRNPDPKIQADFERQQALVLPESKYAGVLAAMRARDKDGLKKSVAELQASGTKLSDIKKRFAPRTQDGRQKQLFHESAALERKFRESLTPAQRALYDAALKERQEQWNWFRRFY